MQERLVQVIHEALLLAGCQRRHGGTWRSESVAGTLARPIHTRPLGAFLGLGTRHRAHEERHDAQLYMLDVYEALRQTKCLT